MLVALEKNPASLTLTPLEGEQAYQPMAQVEKVYLEDAIREDGIITGRLLASWGLVLSEQADAFTRRGLMGKRSFFYGGLRPTPHEAFRRARRAIVQVDTILEGSR